MLIYWVAAVQRLVKQFTAERDSLDKQHVEPNIPLNLLFNLESLKSKLQTVLPLINGSGTEQSLAVFASKCFSSASRSFLQVSAPELPGTQQLSVGEQQLCPESALHSLEYFHI